MLLSPSRAFLTAIFWCVCASLLFLYIPDVVARTGSPYAPYSPTSPSRISVPKPLQPWVDWVLERHPDRQCAVNDGGRTCVWPGDLELSVEATGGNFTLWLLADREARVRLPGGKSSWPLDVAVDGTPAVTLELEGSPSIEVSGGQHRITGRFEWSSSPQSMPIPREVARVRLEVDGKRVEWPQRDRDGSLRLGPGTVESQEEERLEVDVSRRIQDGVPAAITTRLSLRASGSAREVDLGPVLLPDTRPVSLEADLPARFGPTGSLVLQVRPGSYTVTFEALHDGPLESLSAPKKPSPWPSQEFWAVATDDQVRVVNLSGLPGIDPGRTTLPEDWRDLSAYLVQGGQTLEFEEVRRGDPEPAPNRLTLDRQMWLDFDGKGFTVQDRLSGSMHQGWRLETRPPLQLGHAEEDGEALVITRGISGADGVEVRRASVALVGESRIEGREAKMSAVGWNTDVAALTTTLHLPPGWSLFAAMGVDQPTASVVDRWTLFDLFFVLVLTLAIGKIVGFRWAAVAFAALVLSRHESGAPEWIWVPAVIAIALLKVTPEGRFKTGLQWTRGAIILILFIILAPYTIEQVRVGISPALERPYQDPTSASTLGDLSSYAYRSSGEANQWADSSQRQESLSMGRMSKRNMSKSEYGKRTRANEPPWEVGGQAKQMSLQQDPNAVVQTGPGLPLWSWNTHALSWSGSVSASHKFQLWLIGPKLQLFVNSCRILLLLLLALKLSGLRKWLKPPEGGSSAKGSATSGSASSAGGSTTSGSASSAGLSENRNASPTTGSDKALEVPSSGNGTDAASSTSGHTTSASFLGLLFATASILTLCSTAGIAKAGEPEVNAQNASLPAPEELSPSLLDELETRLFKPPLCAPNCLSSSRLELRVADDRLTLLAEVHAGIDAAWPLPGPARVWTPADVSVDGVESFAMVRSEDDFLHLRLEPGVHQIRLEGPLPPTDSMTLQFGQIPKRVEWTGEGWLLAGLRADGTVERSVQLTRALSGASSSETRSSENLAPWLEVVRTLDLGIPWRARTEVIRKGPTGSPLTLKVPLLPGEAVMDDGFQVKEGQLLVALDRDRTQVSWFSTLQDSSELILSAPSGVPWTERWVVSCSPVFACSADGIAPVTHILDDRWSPEWRPWPGESVTLHITRPEAVEGQTVTIRSATHTFVPGKRMSESTLELRINASQGGTLPITLPRGARLQELSANGSSLPVQARGESLPLPLQAGEQSFKISWQLARGQSVFDRVPEVDLGTPAVNARVTVQAPGDRWILMLFGPPWGPIPLFWSYVIIAILAAPLLSRLPFSPLGSRQWLLLGLGIVPVALPAAAVVVLWFMAVGFRKRRSIENPWWFNGVQLFFAGFTLAAMGALYFTVQAGLLGDAPMNIQGAGSSGGSLHWLADRIDGPMPQPLVISLPMWVWRVVMLSWSLWLASSLVKWLPWAWRATTGEGIYRWPMPFTWPWDRWANWRDKRRAKRKEGETGE